MVEATYEQTNGRVIIGAGMSEQFSVNIGLRQGSALSPLLFIVVMELISRKVSMKDTSRKLLYADDLAIVAEDKEETHLPEIGPFRKLINIPLNDALIFT